MTVAQGKVGVTAGAGAEGWRLGPLTYVGAPSAPVLTWAFRFLYTNSISCRHRDPRSTPRATSAPRAAAAAGEEVPMRVAVSGFCSRSTSLFLPPAPSSSTPHPGYLLSSSRSSVMSKRAALSAQLRHPGLQRPKAEVRRGSDLQPIHTPASPPHTSTLPKAHPPLACSHLTTHARVSGMGSPCPARESSPRATAFKDHIQSSLL